MFYRDLALSGPFTFGGLIALFLGFETKFTPVFWVCLVVATAAILVATKRRVLIAGLFLFAAVRFVVVFVMSRSVTILGVAALCALIAFAIVATDKSEYPDSNP